VEERAEEPQDAKPEAEGKAPRDRVAVLFRGAWLIFVVGMTGVGVALGGPVADWASGPISRLTDTSNLLSLELGIRAICGLVAFLFALRWFRWLVQSVTYLERMPLLDKAAAALGVLLGLIIALLATMPFATIPGVGLPVRLLAVIVLVPAGIFFALSAKDQMVYVFPSLATTQMDSGVHTLPEGTKMLDTNIIIDGRVADVAACGFLEGLILVPGFILRELRAIADSADDLKRARGRRGLEILNRMQSLPTVRVVIYEDYPETDNPQDDVDVRLVKLARARNASIITNDFGVAELARLHGVRVLNVHELAQALRPAYLPGEEMVVTIVREGKEPGQGVGYLDDGTMVVVEAAAKYIGKSVPVVVTSSLQTSAGRMIFAELNLGQPVPSTSSQHPRRGGR
jgi:uncharacterized protein YacL